MAAKATDAKYFRKSLKHDAVGDEEAPTKKKRGTKSRRLEKSKAVAGAQTKPADASQRTLFDLAVKALGARPVVYRNNVAPGLNPSRCKMKWCYTQPIVLLQAHTGGLVFHWAANNIYAPKAGTYTTLPAGYTWAMNTYDHYAVEKSTIKVDLVLCPTGDIVGGEPVDAYVFCLRLGHGAIDGGTFFDNFNNIKQDGLIKYQYFTASNNMTFRRPITLEGSYDSKKYWGEDAHENGNTFGDPGIISTHSVVWTTCLMDVDTRQAQSLAGIVASMQVEINYDVILWDPTPDLTFDDDISDEDAELKEKSPEMYHMALAAKMKRRENAMREKDLDGNRDAQGLREPGKEGDTPEWCAKWNTDKGMPASLYPARGSVKTE